jgi:membrane dipeptidase
MKRVPLAVALLVTVVAGVFFYVVPTQVEASLNRTLAPPPYRVSERASALHATLLVADLHADSLLWDRDLLARGSRGQVDVPRLIEGNVALQAFTIVTKTPRGQNIERNTDATDNVTLLALAQRWPPRTFRSLAERVLYQAGKLADASARSDGRLTLIRSSADLSAYLELRKKNPAVTAGFLGVEGAHALEGRLDNVDRFFDAGVRMMAPTHFFDNDIGGSAHGVAKGGLTEKGRAMIARMEQRKMILDLAHASSRTIADALAVATRPVLVSHTGVKGTCDNARNLSDDEVRGIAAQGGLIGIGFWSTAVCGTDAAAIARAIGYAVKLVGADHVALGSDFDGAVAQPFDATGVAEVTDALLAQGLDEGDVRKVMGESALRFLAAQLP